MPVNTSFEENLVFALTKDYPNEFSTKATNIILNAYVNLHGDPMLIASDSSRESGNSPNTVLSSAIGILGKNRVKSAQKAVEVLIDAFQFSGLDDPTKGNFNYKEQLKSVDSKYLLGKSEDDLSDSRAELILNAIDKLDGSSIFINFLKDLSKKEGKEISPCALLAAFTTTISWKSLMRKRLSKLTLINLPWYFKLYSAMVGSSTKSSCHGANSFCGISNDDLVSNYAFGETAFLALVNRRPNSEELFTFNILMGLLVSNGPGTISAQGAKGAVSADGSEDPFRVQINKAFIGFMTHTGFAHGGNGYEGMAF